MVNITTPSFLNEGKYMCDLHQKWWETLWVSGGDKCPQPHWPGIPAFHLPSAGWALTPIPETAELAKLPPHRYSSQHRSCEQADVRIQSCKIYLK